MLRYTVVSWSCAKCCVSWMYRTECCR